MFEDGFRDYKTLKSPTWVRPAAVVTAAILVLGIILTATTNFAAWILPMDEGYLTALIPRAVDGAEPLSLKSLEQQTAENVLTVRGSVENRAEFAVSGITAVIQPMDQYGLPLTPVEVPIEPAQVPAQETGTFETTVTLNERPAGYSIKFKLADGPFVPHKDERGTTLTLPAPSISIPAINP